MNAHTQSDPVSLRISVTDRCQQRCLYCMPSDGLPKLTHGDILTFEEIVRFVALVRDRFGLSKVHITGGEPLVRPGITSLFGMLACENLPDLALTTNGQILAEMISELRRAGLQRVNISLDTLTPDTYARLTRSGDLCKTLEGIDAAISAGITPIKLNAVVLRGYNDEEVVDLARFALQRGCAMRFIELMPIGCAQEMFHDCFVPASEIRARLEECFRFTPVLSKRGQSSREFLAEDGAGRQGVVALISPQTHPFCEGCRRLRLTSTGRLISCLAHGEGPNVRGLIASASARSGDLLTHVVLQQIRSKRPRDSFVTTHPMVAVGG